MKYWWLTYYVPFLESITEKELSSKKGKNMLQQLRTDYSCFCLLPKHYLDYYQKIKLIPATSLSDCGLQLLLSYYIYQGNVVPLSLEKRILSGEMIVLIKELLKMSDTSLPATDYTLLEMLEEVTRLPNLSPTVERVKQSNIASCYTCRNIFYIDAIYQKNKKKECLCPYCNHSTMYFDSDYLPMDRNFLLLAYLYHQTDIPYAGLLSFLEQRVQVVPDNQGDYSFVNTEATAIFDSKQKEISMPFVSPKKSLASNQEEQLSFAVYRLLCQVDHKKNTELSICCNYAQTREQAVIYAITLYETILLYYLQHYFTSIKKIILNVPKEVLDIYVNCLSDFLKMVL